ncbi:MAG: hypothetical protein GTO14_25015 [Anaerolineales bacterium]|nr:hypothetical protein [Anaerolineales bacterium]
MQELIGIWSNDVTNLRYGEDGLFSVAYTVPGLESSPVGWGTFAFDGELLTFFSDEEENCRGKTGIYNISFGDEGETIYIKVEDSCLGREENMTLRPWQRYSP